VSVDSAVVWARADRPARALIDWSTTESFKNSHRAAFVDVLPEADLTANVLIEGLPAGQDIFYRVQLQDHASPTVLGDPPGAEGAKSRARILAVLPRSRARIQSFL
jgi:alkaline phosphatase D